MTNNEEVPEHQFRGHRVPERTSQQINMITQKLSQIMKLKRSSFSRRNIGALINSFENIGVNVDVIYDSQWLDCTRATVDPNSGMIYMPQKLFFDLMRAKPEAIRIFLHELGHIFLCHKPVLHFAEGKAKVTEDSEWQADYFADALIAQLKLPEEGNQLEFKNF